MPLRTLSKLALACVATSAVAAPAPLASSWQVDAGTRLATPRAAHQATRLDGDLVLLTGGCSGAGCSPAERSAELVDGRSGRLALVAGGWTGSATTASAETSDPQSRRFTVLSDMRSARMDATLTPLADGGALIAGGAVATNRPLAQAEVFDRDRL